MPVSITIRLMTAILSLALLMFFGPIPVDSQDDPPLFITINGQLWRWSAGDNTHRAITDKGFVHELVLSPNGSLVVYSLQDGYDTYNDSQSDIWLYQIASEQQTKITSDPGLHRSPSWSPDGSQLAWNENGKLAIHDLASASTKLVADLPGGGGDAGLIAVTPVSWGKLGIVSTYPGFMAVISGMNRIMIVFNPDGEVVYQAEIHTEVLNQSGNLSPVWVRHEGQSYIGLDYRTDAGIIWDMVDPVSAHTMSAVNIPELYSQTEADGSVSLARDTIGSWWVISADGRPQTELGQLPQGELAISPDGQQVVYNSYAAEGVYLWENGKTQRLFEDETIRYYPAHLAWGSTSWRTRADDLFKVGVPTDTGSSSCMAASDLALGLQAQVRYAQFGLYRHTQPFRLADRIIPNGGTFTIVGGPICPLNPFGTWWLVEYEGATGWITDGIYDQDDNPALVVISQQ